MKHFLTYLIILTSSLILLSHCQNKDTSSEEAESKTAVVVPKVIEEGEGIRKINGSDLFVKIIGKGEPILVVHGGPGLDHSYLFPQMKQLAEGYQLIFYDQQGAGKSSFNPDTNQISVNGFVEDIEGLRKHLGIEKLNLMSHSWGGHLALRYGIKYPDNLKRILLLSPMSGSSKMRQRDNDLQRQRENPEDGKALVAIRESEDFKKGRPNAFEKMYRISYRREFFNKDLIDSLNLDLPDNFIVNSAKLFKYMGQDLQDFDLHADLAKIKCPVLLLYGDYESTALESRALFKAAMPQAEYLEIKEAGHFPYIEKPKEFITGIQQFMNK